MKKTMSIKQDRPGQTKSSAAITKPRGVKPLPEAAQEPAAQVSEHYANSEVSRVTFEYFDASAKEVLIGGSFNHWQPSTTPMTQQRGGKWSAELLLKPDHYEYRFVVDGEWKDDPMACGYSPNPFNGLNSVREVKSSGSHSSGQPQRS